jgi:hypothetical protein
MELVGQLLAVAGLGPVALWAAIAAGLAFHLPPAVVAATAGLGAGGGIVAVIAVGAPLRAALLRRYGARRAGRPGLIDRIWARGGALGFCLAAPLLLGTPLGTALGLALGLPVRRLVLGMTAGIALWVTLYTLGALLGWAGLAGWWGGL